MLISDDATIDDNIRDRVRAIELKNNEMLNNTQEGDILNYFLHFEGYVTGSRFEKVDEESYL